MNPDGDERKPNSFEDMLTSDNLLTWSNPNYWKDIFPENLFISEVDYSVEDVSDCKPAARQNEDDPKLRTRLVKDGYAMVDSLTHHQSRFDELTDILKEGISLLHEMKTPAVFIILCDEFWEYAQIAKEALKRSTHPCNIFNFDILAWYVDPKENSAGFSPHRDRQPNKIDASFHDDDQAKYVTLWTALSDATPENSCLYVIPKQYDPGYATGDGEKDPLHRALPTKESYQHIRALPCESGDSVLFTHRILHWGSRGNSETSVHPRIAISFVCSDPAFERPYIDSNYFTEDRIPVSSIMVFFFCFTMGHSNLATFY